MTEIIVSTKHAESSAPSIDATEAAVAQHLALARLRAAEKIHRALDHDEPLSAGLHKLCVDALKLPLDRAAASPVATDPETVAPELRAALHRLLEQTGIALRLATEPARAPASQGAAHDPAQ
ncbi:hypothetical protein ABWH91_14045 [Phycisphaerales bacterium ac7]